MKSPLVPLNQNIVIKVSDSEVTESGLYISGEQGDKTEAVAIKGIVVAIAPDIKTGKEFPIKVGDKLAVAKWEGQILKVEAESYVVVKQKDVLGIL